MTRLPRDIQLRFHYAGESDTFFEEDYQTYKKLYHKSTWALPPAFNRIEKRLDSFEQNIQQERNRISNYTRKSTNLTKLQLHSLKTTKQQNDLLIIQTDKNCGPATIDRDYYITRIL